MRPFVAHDLLPPQSPTNSKLCQLCTQLSPAPVPLPGQTSSHSFLYSGRASSSTQLSSVPSNGNKSGRRIGQHRLECTVEPKLTTPVAFPIGSYRRLTPAAWARIGAGPPPPAVGRSCSTNAFAVRGSRWVVELAGTVSAMDTTGSPPHSPPDRSPGVPTLWLWPCWELGDAGESTGTVAFWL